MTANKILALFAFLILALMNIHYQVRLNRLERVFLATIEECGEAWLEKPIAQRHIELIRRGDKAGDTSTKDINGVCDRHGALLEIGIVERTSEPNGLDTTTWRAE